MCLFINKTKKILLAVVAISLVAAVSYYIYAKVFVKVDKGQIGNANYYNHNNGRYYEDAEFKKEANDNTTYISDLLSRNGVVHIPKGNFLCKGQIQIKGKHVKFIGNDTKIIFDANTKNVSKAVGVTSYIVNSGFSRDYNAGTAQNISFEGINFELKQTDNNDFDSILVLANIDGGSIKNCSFISDKRSNKHVTLVDLYSCCRNYNIRKSTFINMTAASKGSCIWIRNQTHPQQNNGNVTENITVKGCSFTQNSDDEILAVYSSIGVVKKVSVENSEFYDYSDNNAKVLSTYPSEDKYHGTVSDIIFSGNYIFSEKISNFIITVGGSHRKNKVSNVSIQNNEINVSEDSDEKCAIIYVNNIGTNIQDVKVNNNSITVNKLINGTAIYNANYAQHNIIKGELNRGIVNGESYGNTIINSRIGIESPYIAKKNQVINCWTGISCTAANNFILENSITLAPDGLCGIEVKKSSKDFKVQCSKNTITTSNANQYSFIVHGGDVQFNSNIINGPGSKTFINKKNTVGG